MKTIKTKIHTFQFSMRDPDQEKAFYQLIEQLEKTPGRGQTMEAIGTHNVKAGDIELKCEHLYANQWNSDQGRVFDLWIECYYFAGCRQPVRNGHYLEITQEMIDIRNNTLKCGYTGMQFPVGTTPAINTSISALGSPYLKESDFHLLRLLPVSEEGGYRSPLTEEELAIVKPLYIGAQINCQKQRDEEKEKKERIKLKDQYDRKIAEAEIEYHGKIWMMDHGVNTDNCLYYPHEEKFCFGWQGDGFSPELEAEMRNKLDGFKYPFYFATKKKYLPNPK